MSFSDAEQRAFQRFPISLDVEVSSVDSGGNRCNESTVLKDISGGGANFISVHPDWYFIGQKIDLVIQLPGADELNAEMKGSGTIAWIRESGDVTSGEDAKAFIGVCMADLMVFERIASSLSGEAGKT